MPNILIAVPSKKEKLPLSATHPELAKEAEGWDPSEFTYGSGRIKTWKCPLGHVYEASIDKRTSRLHGCPICSGHKVLAGFNDLATTHPLLAASASGWDPTQFSFGSERKLQWKCELGHEWSATIINRVKLNQGCAVCANKQVIPGVNDLQTTHPVVATEALGWDPQMIVAGSERKLEWICSLGHIWKATPKARTRQESGCPFCAGRKVLIGFNDLGTTHQLIASQAVDWDPKTVTHGSNQKKPWRCDEGHTWNAQIISRVQGSNCPVCSGQEVLAGFNDLETTDPKLAKEADNWDPRTVTRGSNSRRKWRCINGHSWLSTVNNRAILERGCPSCAESGFDPNENGYIYFLEQEDWNMYQIGITNVPDKRLRSHKRLGWRLLELRGPMDGHLTQQWETAILRMLKAKGADLSNEKIAGKFDGYSEAWSKSTFEVSSIKELMKLTEEYEGNQ